MSTTPMHKPQPVDQSTPIILLSTYRYKMLVGKVEREGVVEEKAKVAEVMVEEVVKEGGAMVAPGIVGHRGHRQRQTEQTSLAMEVETLV